MEIKHANNKSQPGNVVCLRTDQTMLVVSPRAYLTSSFATYLV